MDALSTTDNSTVTVTLASGSTFDLINANGDCNYHYLKSAGVVCASDMLEAMLRAIATTLAFGK